MRLLDAIREVANCPDDLIIYVLPPWSPEADAVFMVADGNEAEPVQFHGQQYHYFLETFIARDFMEDYAATVEGAAATESERCERLIRYARDDA